MTESEIGSIRSLHASDVDAAVALNNAEVPNVGPTSPRHFAGLLRHAGVAWGIDHGDSLAALLVAFEPGTAYESTNYRWFDDRFDDFVYVDRVVVAPELKGRGIGRHMYEQLASRYRGVTRQITCEVNVDPPNDSSMAFHLSLGFVPVGNKPDGPKTVALLAKPLGSVEC